MKTRTDVLFFMNLLCSAFFHLGFVCFICIFGAGTHLFPFSLCYRHVKIFLLLHSLLHYFVIFVQSLATYQFFTSCFPCFVAACFCSLCIYGLHACVFDVIFLLLQQLLNTFGDLLFGNIFSDIFTYFHCNLLHLHGCIKFHSYSCPCFPNDYQLNFCLSQFAYDVYGENGQFSPYTFILVSI